MNDRDKVLRINLTYRKRKHYIEQLINKYKHENISRIYFLKSVSYYILLLEIMNESLLIIFILLSSTIKTSILKYTFQKRIVMHELL